MKPREWAMFIGLGLIWGSSFLWIKVALQEIGPFALVAWRLLIGALGLAVVVAVRRPVFPRDRRTLGTLALLGLSNTAVPFVLISWGEQSIDSAVASILNGTVPLFAMVMAHFALKDDRITTGRLGGLALGFVGVVVLLSGDLEPGGLGGAGLGQLAVLLAAILYAASGVIARKNLHQVSPTVQAFLPLVVADVFIWTGAMAFEAPRVVPSVGSTWLALVWLGLLGSCAAYLLLFSLLHQIGPTRTSMITYIFPVVGLILGVVFLQEPLSLRLVLGAALIVVGIVVVNAPDTLRAIRLRRERSPRHEPAGPLGPGAD